MPPTPADQRRADELIAAPPRPAAQAWQKISAGTGAHGPRRAAARPEELATGPPLTERLRGDRRLRLLRARSRQHGRPGLDRRQPLAHRGVLPAGHERGRAGPLPGPRLAALIRAYHLVHARPGLAVSPSPTSSHPTPAMPDPGPAGAENASTRPASATTSAEATR